MADMMRKPTKVLALSPLARQTKELLTAFPKMTFGQAQELVRLMNASHNHKTDEAVLQRANEIIGGYGVEAIPCERCGYRPYYMNFVAGYVNMGDTYSTTLLLDYVYNVFRIGSWGDFLEDHENREHAEEIAEEMEAEG